MGGAASIDERYPSCNAEDLRQLLVVLPAKLIFRILHDWLGSWADISRLDVAYCNTSLRQGLLHIFALEEMRFADNELIEIARKDHAVSFVGFCLSRGLRPFSIVANAASARAIAPLRFLGDLPSVRHLRMLACGQEITQDSFYFFLRMFPSTTTLDCSQWVTMTDEHIHSLESLCDSRLEYVKLPLQPPTQTCLSSAAIARLAENCSSTLRGLDCDVQDTSWVGAVAEHCAHLRLLSLPFHGILSASWPTAFCAGLEEIHLHNSLSDCMDEAGAALVALAQRCTRLHALTVHPPLSHLSAERAVPLLSQCPSLRWLHVSDFDYRRQPTDVEDLLSLSISSQGETADTTLHTLLSVLSPPLRVLRAPLSLATLRLLGARFGSRLESLDCLGLREDVDRTAWQHDLVEKAPSLRHLALVDDRNLLSGWLPKLSTYCPRLTSLSVRQATQLEDASVVGWVKLVQWKKALRRLVLEDCPRISDAILPALTPLSLQSLQLSGTAVSVEGLACWLNAATNRPEVVLGGRDGQQIVERLRRELTGSGQQRRVRVALDQVS